jgi:hypothetical protein
MVVDGRFTIEALSERGGMGTVYRAIDSATQRPVALKLLDGAPSPESVYRFNREATLLAGLKHPGIVSFVAHGTTEVGRPYLVMEWLEGEDLARRLAREPLSLPETLALLRRVAEALAVAHRQDVVHRDLKPSNLFLKAGRPEDVVVLDFGLARHAVSTMVRVTGRHTVLGTPGYMAPEQASSQPEIPLAADIFSLGCVLYECLTGKRPFEAPHFAAVLAKILFAEPAPLSTVRPGLPAGLQVLVDRMLAKDARRRLADADRLLEMLAALEAVPEMLLPRAETGPGPVHLEGAEQKLVSVLLVSLQAMNEETVDWTQGIKLRDSLRTVLSLYGGQVELLADGSLVATLLPERGTATDQAALAARCALTFKERWHEAAVVLTTGLGVFNERLPVGEAMDRAGRLLHQLERLPSSSSGVVMDEVTAGLLGSGFQLSRLELDIFLLQGEQRGADASRPLLGNPTPCVGREQELALLDFNLTSCIEEPTARALLVTAPPGVGKSRLRHEFLRRVEQREQPPLVLLGRGDPMSGGASYGLLGQALRKLCGIVEGENLERRRARLYERVARHLPVETAQQVVGFLGELCAIPFPEEGSARLQAARGDPRLMSIQLGRALVAFLDAECAHQPVLLVLEDLHWSDALTVKLVDEVLRELADRPLMVLALARPEVKELHPGLWARRLQELALNGLSRKACARLAREVLGAQIAESMVQRIVDQSDGNALFLEELIRMVAEGRKGAVPGSVLAVLQARLQQMEPGVRRVLLAASLFGRTFWSGGVKELLLPELEEVGDVELHLRRLVEQEIIELQPGSRFPSWDEYRFRHALVRDAAYGLMPDSSRPTGHRLAGDWLERMGELNPLVLATHFQLGQQPERAARYFTRGAEQLFERHELQETLWCVEAALACGVSGEPLARLQALHAMVVFWLDEPLKAVQLGGPALEGQKAGSPLWCRLMGCLILVNGHLGRCAQMLRLGELLLQTQPEPGALAAYVEAIAYLGTTAVWSGVRQKVEAVFERLRQVGAEALERDALVRGWMRLLEFYFLHHLGNRPWRALLVAEQGMRDFNEIGAEQGENSLRLYSGLAMASLGGLWEGVERMRESLAIARRTEQGLAVLHTQQYLGALLLGSPEPAHQQEGHDMVLEWVSQVLVPGWMNDEDPPSYRRGVAYTAAAHEKACNGEVHEAESYARKACVQLAAFPACRIFARTLLSTTLRAQGKAGEARREAALGVQELKQMGNGGSGAVAMYLAWVEACFADGDARAGEAALCRALECVRVRASDIPEPELRERFLRQVPENARLLELARQRWGEAAA